MSRTPWVLYDAVLDEEYNWPVNPHTDDGSHSISTATNYEVMAGLRQAPDGQDRIDTIIHSAGNQAVSMSYSGFVYTQEQLEALEEWNTKDYAVILTDDLGRQFSIRIEGIQFERVRSNKKPYKHSYTFKAFILEEL